MNREKMYTPDQPNLLELSIRLQIVEKPDRLERQETFSGFTAAELRQCLLSSLDSLDLDPQLNNAKSGPTGFTTPTLVFRRALNTPNVYIRGTVTLRSGTVDVDGSERKMMLEEQLTVKRLTPEYRAAVASFLCTESSEYTKLGNKDLSDPE